MRAAATHQGSSECPPDQITLIYRKVGKSHVFTAHELPGFHVGCAELGDLFKLGMNALSEHVSLLHARKVRYEAEQSFTSFRANLRSPDLTAPFLMTKRMEVHAPN